MGVQLRFTRIRPPVAPCLVSESAGSLAVSETLLRLSGAAAGGVWPWPPDDGWAWAWACSGYGCATGAG